MVLPPSNGNGSNHAGAFSSTLANIAKRSYDVITRSPRKIIKACSPRKRQKTIATRRTTRAQHRDQNDGPSTNDASIHASPPKKTRFRVPMSRFRVGTAVPEPPSGPSQSQTFAWSADGRTPTDISTDDPFLLSGVNAPAETSMKAAEGNFFEWKLKPPSVEEVEDDDDRMSTLTFLSPSDPHILWGPEDDTSSPYTPMSDSFPPSFVNRSHRFADAYYNKHLTGPEAAWAAKRYHGHRTLPTKILDELLAAGITK
uniref:Uncharacterized protein n=1 Tax=Mycena chlorophos TaxID=658473 RepID=A0ABQ0L0V8_MYCCL|nr:predicted protein [Mycena chlorophos]